MNRPYVSGREPASEALTWETKERKSIAVEIGVGVWGDRDTDGSGLVYITSKLPGGHNAQESLLAVT